MALLMKHVIENLSRKAKARLYTSFDHFTIEGVFTNSCTLVTRRSPSILKMGVTPCIKCLKIKVGCGNRGKILA